MTMSQVLYARSGKYTLPLVFSDRLKEIDLGVLQGGPSAAWREAITGDPMSFRPPQGESWLDVQERVTSYLMDTILPTPHREILVVAHGGVNRGLIASLLGIPLADTWRGPGLGTPQDNACINTLELNGEGEITRAVINDTSHLTGQFHTASRGQLWLPAERRWEMLDPESGSLPHDPQTV